MRRVDKLVIALSMMMAWVFEARAVIRFVPDDFVGIQEALDESNPNDTIIVRNGTYTGPFFIYARNTTLASEYLLTPDPAYIANTIIRPPRGNPNHRCFFTQAGDSSEHDLKIVGFTIALARAIQTGQDLGGGIYLTDRTAEISDCVFKSCLAYNGGAVYATESNLTLTRCFFQNNDAIQFGQVLHARLSNVLFQECDLGPTGRLHEWESGWDDLIQIEASGIELRNSVIHDVGYTDGERSIFRNDGSQMGTYLRLYGCTIENNNLWSFMDCWHASPRHLIMDSCLVRHNHVWFHFLRAWAFEGMQALSVTRCTFVDNYRPNSDSGVMNFFGAPMRFAIEENYFIRNYGATWACIGLRGGGDPLQGRVQRNYFHENTSDGYPFESDNTIVLWAVQDDVVEYNYISPNVGHGVFSEDRFPGDTSFALHNFWGDSTGPYEATRNPGGRGDTTNSFTIYDEWLQSEEEIPDTSLYPPPQVAVETPWPVPSMWYLANVYPNPFNGEFRVDLAGITGLDFTLKLYDILGREVAQLRSGPTVRGTMAFQIPQHLAAGVYFLHARDHMYAETKKLLYLK